MNISSLSIQQTSTDKSLTWNFSPGTGQLSRAWVLYGTREEIESIRTMLSRLEKDNGKPLHYSTLAVTDDGGHNWNAVIDKGHSTFVKHGTRSTETLTFPRFLAQIWERLDDPKIQIQDVECINHFQLLENEGVFALNISALADKEKTESFIRKEIRKLEVSLGKELGCGDLANSGTLIQIFEELTPLYVEIKSIDAQIKNLSPQKSDANTLVDKIVRLEKRVGLLRELEHLLGLVKTQAQVGVSAEQLTSIQERVAENLRACNLKVIPDANSSLNWQSLLKTLAQMEALKQFLLAADTATQKNFSQIKGLHSQHLTVMEGFLREDQDFMRDVLQIARDLPAGVPQESQNGLLLRFKRMITRAKVARPPDRDERSALLVKRAAKINQKLKDLESSFERQKVSIDEMYDKLTEFFEEKASKLNHIRMQWRNTAKALTLAENHNLASFINYIVKYTELKVLGTQLKFIRSSNLVEKNAEKQIARIISQWQILQGEPVKTLESGDDLLAAANRLLAQQNGLFAELKRLHKSLLTERAEDQIGAYLRAQRGTLLKLWEKRFETAKLPILAPDDAKTSSFMRSGSLLRAWHALRLQSSLPTQEVFNNRAMTINTWYLPDNLSQKGRLEFVKTMSSIKPHAVNIILTSSSELYALLKKSGIGLAHRGSTERREPSKSVPAPEARLTLDGRRKTQSPPPGNSNSVKPLDAKTQAILDLLNGEKRSQT